MNNKSSKTLVCFNQKNYQEKEMASLESIVPSLKLCKQLTDKFPSLLNNTALVWEEAFWCEFKPEGEPNKCYECFVTTQEQGYKDKQCSSAGVKITPAPTFAEILNHLPIQTDFFYRGLKTSQRGLSYENSDTFQCYILEPEQNENMATLALKLFLKLNQS